MRQEDVLGNYEDTKLPRRRVHLDMSNNHSSNLEEAVPQWTIYIEENECGYRHVFVWRTLRCAMSTVETRSNMRRQSRHHIDTRCCLDSEDI